MNLGTLTATVDSDTRGFVQGLATAAARMESFSREVKKLARETAQMGMGIMALAGAAVHMASSVDSGVRSSMEGLKDAMLTLAVQVAQMVEPALKRLTVILHEVADWFAGLSPKVRENIAHWVLFAVEAAAVAMAVAKVAGIVTQLSAVFSALAGAVASIGLGTLLVVILGLAVALAALVAAVIFVRKMWVENWGGIQDKFHAVVMAIREAWDWLIPHLVSVWQTFVKMFTDQIRVMATIIGVVFQALGMDLAADFLDTIKTGADWVDQLFTPEGMESLKSDAMAAGKAVKDYFKQGLGDLAKDLGLDKLFNNGGHAQQYHEQRDSIVGHRLGEEGEQGQMTQFYANTHADSLARVGKLGDEGEQGNTGSNEAAKYTAEMTQQQKDLTDLNDAIKRAKAAELKEQEEFDEKLQKIADGLHFAGNLLLSKLGELGQVIHSAIQGFQSGGVWGAIIAVILEMLSRFKRWQEIMDVANGQLEAFLSDTKAGLGALIDGLKQLMGGLGVILHVIHQILVPIMKIVGKIFEMLGSVFAMLGVILEPIVSIIDGILTPILDQLGQAFQMLEPILRVVAHVVLGIVRALNHVTLIILDVVDVLSFGIADSWVQSIKQGIQKANDKIDSTMDSLGSGASFSDLAKKSAAAAENVGKLGNAAEKTTDQLYNLPQGFKYAMYRYNATASASSNMSDERNNFLQTGNPTTDGNGSSAPGGANTDPSGSGGGHDSGASGGTKGPGGRGGS